MSRNPTVKATILVLLVIGLSALGAFLAATYGANDYGQVRQQRGLQIIQEQLSDLKELLLDYRKCHGVYPTNDEGLAALDNFESRFKVPLRISSDAEAIMYALANNHFWEMSQAVSGAVKHEKGRFPKGPRDFSWALSPDFLTRPGKGEPPPVDVELAIGKNGSVFVLAASGVLSPRLLQFMYENRGGLDPAKFAFSPANNDPGRRYSVLVDEGVYVYSLDAQVCAETLDRLWWEDVSPVIVGLALLAAALVAAILLFAAGGRRMAIAAMVAPAVLGGFFGSIRSTCYAMDSLFSHRSPQMVVQQRDLLEKYRGAGVISEETYRKSLAAVEPVKAQAPSEGKK